MRSSVFLGVVLALSWIGPSLAQDKIHIFACEPEWASLAQALAGDAADITTAVDGTHDPSKVQVTDKLVAAIRKANLVICSGDGLESAWLPALLKKTPNPSIQTGNSGNLMASDFVIPLDLPSGVDEEASDSNDSEADTDSDIGGNPHVHLNPHNIMLVAEELQQRLNQIDPDNRALYDKRYNAFFNRWQDAMDRWEQSAAGLFGIPVATEDDSFAYLIDWLGLVKVASVEDTPGVAPDKARIKTLAETLKKRKVHVILRTPYETDPATKALAAATKAEVVVLPYTVGGDKESTDLFTLFDRTLALLEQHVTS